MELRIPSFQSYPNLEVIRHVLGEMGGSEVVKFTVGCGAMILRWAHSDGGSREARIAIPLAWLMDSDKVEKLKEAIQHFATSVRFASTRQAQD